MQLFKDSRKCLFGKTVSGVFNVAGSKSIRITEKHVVWKGTTFPIDTAKPAYRRKSKWIYLIDLDMGQQTLGEEELSISPILFDLEFNNHITKDLLSRLGKVKLSTEAIIMILMAFGMGMPLGYVLCILFPVGA
jgi:hypothetical protein